jgi:hypothetical protein
VIEEHPTGQEGVVRLGGALRDAAVDPRKSDFLPPVNAGMPGAEGNPHGPHVVSLQALSPVSARPPYIDGRPTPREVLDRLADGERVTLDPDDEPPGAA